MVEATLVFAGGYDAMQIEISTGLGEVRDRIRMRVVKKCNPGDIREILLEPGDCAALAEVLLAFAYGSKEANR